MTEIATIEIADGIATILIDHPPVNALSLPVRRAIVDAIAKVAAGSEARALVLSTKGRTFFPGADIAEFGRPFDAPDLNDVVQVIEDSAIPIIAAIHGTALGGGLEVALGAHYRIAAPTAKLGLPEVTLGLIPGAGGTLRLPRAVDAELALELITTGKPIPATRALGAGLIDRLADGDLLDAAREYASEILSAGLGPRRLREADIRIADQQAFHERLNTLSASPRPAVRAAVEAVRGARDLPFAEALVHERALFGTLMAGRESQALRYLFFAERAAGQVVSIETAKPRPVASVGVIGAGTMGGGIAMNFLNAGLPVILVETSAEALDRGMSTIRRNYEATARKGRMSLDQVEERMSLINPVVTLDALGDVDLIIEAVYESMPVKRDIFGKLDRIAKPGAILASNTSFLDLNEIASATGRPSDVVGMHFFSPANVMRLLEIVRGRQTSAEILATALAVGKRIGKLVVVAGVCHGFIANRAMDARRREAERALLAGATPQQIDELLVAYGFPMGQFAMMDLVGLDVMGRGSTERTIMGELVAAGRLGQKSGGGYYEYDEKRRATPSMAALDVIRRFASDRAVEQRAVPADLLERVLAPVVNEGARILEEGIALRASDIDVALGAGYGWPAHTGGPMFWADTVGLEQIIDILEALSRESGLPEHEPAPLLRRLAADGSALHSYSG